MTPELKRDLQLLRMRSVLDPKRHYRKENMNALPKYFQLGTIVAGPTEYYDKLSRHEQKNSIMDELVADQDRRKYFKKKYNELQVTKVSGKKEYYRKLKESRKRK